MATIDTGLLRRRLQAAEATDFSTLDASALKELQSEWEAELDNVQAVWKRTQVAIQNLESYARTLQEQPHHRASDQLRTQLRLDLGAATQQAEEKKADAAELKAVYDLIKQHLNVYPKALKAKNVTKASEWTLPSARHTLLAVGGLVLAGLSTALAMWIKK